ncbi:Sodium-lithium/proton antiporter [bioreactor metagenome]|uniref:Sodium-lithium/proton antiporter n=1 Tax=bioreactor metagenome TaxID=1076179 RepID=A0A644XBR7_9ZZZZ
MELEKRKKFIVNFLYFAIILGIVIVITRYALGMLTPFLIALLVSLLLKPVVAFLRDKCHLHKGFAGALVVTLFYALVGFLLIILGVQVFSAAKSFFLTLPALYTNSIAPWLAKIFADLQAFVAKLDPDTAAAYNVVASNVTQTLGQTVANISKQVVTWVTSITFKTPAFLLHMLIAVIATFFLSIDFPKVKAFLMLQLSEKNRDLVHNIRVHLGRTLWRYTRSYALILLITFAEISLGLFIIGIEKAFAIAAAIAVFDILPVVGSGLVLLPWTIISLVSGNYPHAIGLGILYIVVIIVRNVIEPKIVGDRVGLHPIVTLFSMVVGTFVFGGIGLLGLPITLALIQSLNKQGVIHLYKTSDPAPVPAAEPSSTDQPAAPEKAKRAKKRTK